MMRLHRRMRGQAMTEYVIVVAALAFLLGVGMLDDDSVLWQLVKALQQGYKNYSFALSIPS